MKNTFIVLIFMFLAVVSCTNSDNNNGNDTTSSSSGASIAEPVVGNPPINPTDSMMNIDSTSASVTDTSSH